jgi:hypothetical protein
MARSKTDWDAIAREYIEARSDNVRPKLKTLSDKYGVSFAAIQKKCQRDQWVEKSRMYVRTLTQEIRENSTILLADSLASSQVEFDSECLNVARKLIKQVGRSLTISEQKQEGDDDQHLRPSDLTHYSNTLATAQRVGRIALGADQLDDESMMDRLERKGYKVIDPTIAENETQPETESET